MYTLKLLKQSFVNFIFSSFEKMGENGPRLEEEVKKDEFPDNIKKQSLKELLKKEETKPKLKSNTQIVKDTLGPDYIGKDGKDLKEILGEKTKEELAERKEQNGFSKEIMNNLDKKEIKILKEVLGERTINQASSGEIYTLKQEGFDLAKIFLKDSSGKFSKGKTEYKIGDSFEVEFYGNKDIDRIVGIGDILDINNVSKVSVNGSEGTRKSNPRPGFYNGRYLAIHDNFKVNILETEKFEGDDFNSAITSRFKQVRGKELNNWFYSNLDSGDSSIKIPFNAKSDKDLFSEIINNNFKKELKFDEKTGELSTIDGSDLSSKKELISSFLVPKGSKELLAYPGFKEKLEKVGSTLGISKNDLLIVIGAESGFNPKAVNPISGASGLIQFMPKTAKGLGTTVYAIRQMGPVEQLSLVERYYKPYASKIHNVIDLYKATFFPVSLNHYEKNWVFKSKNKPAQIVSSQNPAIRKYSTRSDGYIDGYAFERYVNAHVASKGVIYEDIKNDVSEVDKNDEEFQEFVFNSIIFYKGEISKSFEQLKLQKEDIVKSGVVKIERGSEKLTTNEIKEIKEKVKSEFGDTIKIVLNLERSYGGQIDV